MLVLAPTRELAVQIDGEAQRFARTASEGEQAVGRLRGRHGRRDTDAADGGVMLRTACLYGGAPKLGQGRQLSRRPQLVIATPGRLIDFVESGELRLGQVGWAGGRAAVQLLWCSRARLQRPVCHSHGRQNFLLPALSEYLIH